MQPSLPRPPKGIVRLKYSTTVEGWNARYMREGVRFSQLFTDSQYGGPEASLEAAIAWRKQAETLLPPMSRREYAAVRRANNSSGESGVHRTIGEYYKGKPRYYWRAMWSPAKGKRRYKTFSVQKFGEEEAKRLAIEARRLALESLDAEWPEGSWPTSRDEGDHSDGVLDQDVFAYEGNDKFAIHKSKERDRTLRQAKLRAFFAAHGDLFCEICRFSFEEQYGALGRGLIEVHHLLPVAEMTQTHKTTLEELMCVCSNCHFALHNGDPQSNLEALRFIFDARRHTKTKNEPSDAADSR